MAKRNKAKRGIVIMGGGKGGVGKTFSSLALLAAIKAAGHRQPMFIHIEAEDRCGRFFPASDTYRYLAVAGDRLEDLEENPTLVYDVLDELCALVEAGIADDRYVVIDLPSNFTMAIASYLAEQGAKTPFGDGGDVLTLAVTHGRSEAMKAAGNSISLMKEALPQAASVVLFNNIDASSNRSPADPVYLKFVDQARALGVVEVLHLNRLMAPLLLRASDDLSIALDELLVLSEGRWQELGLNKFRAGRETSRAIEYVDELESFIQRHTQ
jgi:hypothetical protein